MRKVPKLASTCLSCLLFGFSPTLWALGLGDIKIASHLNEPLEASIPLDDIKGIEKSDIVITVADNAAFEKAGIEPANWVQSIQFTLLGDKQGKFKIKLSTQYPIQDPFADLLIQVAWPGGKIVKEYTLLLDPPKIATSKVSAHTQEVLQTLSSPSFEPALLPAKTTVTAVVKQKPVVSEAQSQASLEFGGSYGPVHDETLWSIARKLVGNSHYSIYQGVMAIAYKNPNAFINGNINQIKQGAVLRLPSQKELNKYSAEKARQFIENPAQLGQALSTQTNEAEQQDQEIEKAPLQQKAAKEQKTQKALTLVAPSDESHTEIPNTIAHLNQQEALSARSKESNPQKFTLEQEALDTLKRSNEEIAQKNQQLQSQNSLLAMQLAAKEEELNRLKHAEHESPENMPASKDVPTKPAMPREYAVVTPEPESNKKALPDLAQTVHAPLEPEKDKSKQEPNAVQNAKHDAQQNEEAKEPVANIRHSERIKRNLLFIVFMVAFTGSILGWIWFSRHRFIVLLDRMKKKFNTSKMKKSSVQTAKLVQDLPQEEIQINYGLQFDLDKALNAVANEEKKFAKHQPVALNKEEKELMQKKTLASLEDAEIYIAYERYQQAEKILKEILSEENPQENLYWDALLKLLELYVLTERYQDYEKWYARVPSDLKETAPKVWSKITLLQDKVQADKAIQTQEKAPTPPLPQDPVVEEKIALAAHHLEDEPLPMPTVHHETTTTPTKLELVNTEEEEFNAQLALAKTYQDVGDIANAKEVLQKLLTSAKGTQKEEIELLLLELNHK